MRLSKLILTALLALGALFVAVVVGLGVLLTGKGLRAARRFSSRSPSPSAPSARPTARPVPADVIDVTATEVSVRD